MSTPDDPAVKSKLPMRWTLRQATGEVLWSILIASRSPATRDTATIRDKLGHLETLPIDLLYAHLDVSFILNHLDAMNGGPNFSSVDVWCSDPNMQRGYLAAAPLFTELR
jgi:hypothetical protein